MCIEIPDNITFDSAATVPVCAIAATVGLYGPEESGGAGRTPPWEEGGRGKYNDEPIFILGGASSVGQYGENFYNSWMSKAHD